MTSIDARQDAAPAGGGPLAETWTPIRILVVSLCFVLNMLDGADMLIIAFVAPVISNDWGLRPEALGAVFAASLPGMAVGCVFVAPLGDRFGRRNLIMGALGLVAIAMIVSGFVETIRDLIILRFLVGVGVGTIGVTMTSMATEFAPARHSSFAAGLVQAGWPVGSIITAFVTALVIEQTGWRPPLISIGVLCLVLLAVVFVLLPESFSFLLRRGRDGDLVKARGIASRLGVDFEARLALAAKTGPERRGLRFLMAGDRLKNTLLLWLAASFGYFVLYFLISWIPKLAVDSGLPIEDAIYAGATYNFGAFLGTAMMGWLAIRFRVSRVIASLFSASIFAMLVFGGTSLPVLPTLIIAACVGITVQGGFNGFWALAAKVYPPELRSTGIGLALGVSRIGAFLGPLVGGFLLGAGLSIFQLFAVFCVAAFIAGMTALFIQEPAVQEN
ncbi:MFS transporter [Maricaulis parjimensis]|uniref:MFS transporter n=1 Tax=Maricaulis parjimensis TaxID=144023 RepID=UPI00193932C1|nr:MFS transporter [Maricaulis parjimensis]